MILYDVVLLLSSSSSPSLAFFYSRQKRLFRKRVFNLVGLGFHI